jgi:hypothetical protein
MFLHGQSLALRSGSGDRMDHAGKAGDQGICEYGNTRIYVTDNQRWKDLVPPKR